MIVSLGRGVVQYVTGGGYASLWHVKFKVSPSYAAINWFSTRIVGWTEISDKKEKKYEKLSENLFWNEHWNVEEFKNAN